jgi:hypothetical protein
MVLANPTLQASVTLIHHWKQCLVIRGADPKAGGGVRFEEVCASDHLPQLLWQPSL